MNPRALAFDAAFLRKLREAEDPADPEAALDTDPPAIDPQTPTSPVPWGYFLGSIQIRLRHECEGEDLTIEYAPSDGGAIRLSAKDAALEVEDLIRLETLAHQLIAMGTALTDTTADWQERAR